MALEAQSLAGAMSSQAEEVVEEAEEVQETEETSDPIPEDHNAYLPQTTSED